MVQLAERAPDRLVDAERVRVLHERGEQQVERFVRLAARRPGGATAPAARASPAGSRRSAGGTDAVKRSGVAGADRRAPRADRTPGRRGRARPRSAFPRSPPPRCSLPCGDADVAEIQVRRHGARVEIDRRLEAPDRLGVVLPAHRLEADLVFEKRENRLVLRPRVDRRPASTAAGACRRPRSTGAAPRAASAG